MEASRRSPGSLAKDEFSPGRPPATQYGADPAKNCPSGGALPLLADEVENRTKASGKPGAKPDGRLCAAAETLLGWNQPDVPSETVVAFLSDYFGLPSPISRVTIAPIETEETKGIAGQLVETVSRFTFTAKQPRFGLATERLRKGTTKIVLLMQDASLDVDPFPRRLNANSKATLSGRLASGLANPKVFISDPRGQLEKPSVPPGSVFQADVACGAQPGRIQVEVRAEDQGTEAVVANFPVGCGTDLPTSVPAPPPDKDPNDTARQEQKVFEMINAERTAVGIPALALDEGVANVARSLSESRREEVRRGGSGESIDVVDRLKKADVISPLVLVNPGQALTPIDAQSRFSRSPVHRANFMNLQATHGGVGVAWVTEGERTYAVVNEIFVRELPTVDTQALREKVRAAIARRRSEARAPVLTKDPALDQVAQNYAQELAANRGTISKERGNQILAPVMRSFRTINVVSSVKPEPLEIAEEPGIVSNAKALGVGVAQGTHPSLGKNAIYVVAILATRR
jgi:uncharacterized protein YkwD